VLSARSLGRQAYSNLKIINIRSVCAQRLTARPTQSEPPKKGLLIGPCGLAGPCVGHPPRPCLCSRAAFADVWCALPKVVFSRTLDSVQGNARLAEASVAEEVTAALAATDKDVSIGGAGLAAAAIELARHL
jgi:hypothetical protein